MASYTVKSYTVRPVEGDDQIEVVIHASDGRNVPGRWCCGQLNSTPPEIQGPARPTSAGLMTS